MGNKHSSNVPKHLKPLSIKSSNKIKTNTSSYSSDTKNNDAIQQKLPDVFFKSEKSIGSKTEVDSILSDETGSFRWVKGRRFIIHDKEVGLDKTIMPSDQMELDKRRLLNFIIRWAFNGNIVAPIQHELKSGIEVLNVGFGPGLWTGHHIIDLAMDYKNTHFTAIDILDMLPEDYLPSMLALGTSPIQALSPVRSNSSLKESQDYTISNLTVPHFADKIQKRKVLDNLDFYQCNILKAGLPFPDNTFDLVKQELVTTSYTLNDWVFVMKEMIRVTKPGGYIQLIEIDHHTHNLGPRGQAWENQMLEGVIEKKQVNARISIYLENIFRSIGLKQVKSKLVSVPIGSWGSELGDLWKQNLELFVGSTAPLISPILNMSVNEYKENWNVFFDESKDSKPFNNFYAVTGRKPMTPLNLDRVDWTLIDPFKPRH